jgi:glycosyltransferase involved in cell wall biosynthesis
MTHDLAVFAPFVGARSETFIRRHMCDLLPGKTVVVTGDAAGHYSGHWTFDGPLLALNAMRPLSTGRRAVRAMARRLGWKSREDDTTLAVEQFLRAHRVRVAMGEFLDWPLTWLPLARKMKIPFFAHAHGYDVSANLRSGRWREAYLQYNAAAGVITMSECSRSRLIALGLRPERIHVIPYGVEVPSAPIMRADRDTVAVLGVGRMTPKKAPILLLDAFRRACEVCPQLRLDFVGEGELYSAAQHFVEVFDLQQRVSLHGGKPSDHVLHLMANADIFLQHSVTDPATGDEEGLPVAILEAMAHSLPVVSTRHAGIPEAVCDGVTGLLVAEGDSRAMGDSLVELARDANLRRRMGVAGWNAARERFSWARERADLRRVLRLESPQG